MCELSSVSDSLKDVAHREEGTQNNEVSRNRDEASSALAQKLLEGWTMLGTSCPTCYSPIMRDRNRRMYCVVCNLPVLSEEEANVVQAQTSASHGHGQMEVQQGRPPVPSVDSMLPLQSEIQIPTAKEKQCEENQKGAENVDFHVEANSDLEPSMKRRAVDIQGLNLKFPEALQQETSLPTVLGSMLETLTAKLEATRHLVERCDDVKDLKEILGVVEQIAHAITTVQSVSIIEGGIQ